MLRRLNVDDLPQTGLQVKVVYLCYYDNCVRRSKQNTRENLPSENWLPLEVFNMILQHAELAPELQVIYTLKRQKMERESSKDCSAFFSWRKGSFSSRNRPSRNSTLFSSRRSPWSVLKCNQVSEVFAEFSGTFCTLWPRQLRF